MGVDKSQTVLKDIGLYKSRFINYLLESKDLCELMLMDESCSEKAIDDLRYKQIFPYLYIDETQTEVLPYLCFEIKIPRIPTGTVKDVQLVVWAYCHKKCMQYSKQGYIGTRADILADMIERQIHNAKDFGIGKFSLQSVGYIFPKAEYYGRELIFNCPDFKVKG